jgi:signal transduction histidine kinase/CheY-like chemotaxis protein/HPt (histidine-containing phosphotransfer) domain-containing protein
MSRPGEGTGRAETLGRRTARLSLLYVLALSAVALLSIAGQMLVQFSLARQGNDSAVVNIAGRQRMLSQKLAKTAISLEHAKSPEERRALRQEIEQIVRLWQSSHAGLQHGDASLNLPGRNSLTVEALFSQIDDPFSAMVMAADALTRLEPRTGHESGEVSRLVGSIRAHEPVFLSGMDEIVAQYEREARLRVARLKSIERLLLGLTLAVLVCEGFFIFRPAVRQIGDAAAELLASRRELEVAKDAAESASKQKTQFLANMSHELRNPLHAVLGNLDLLGRTELNVRQQRYLSTADGAARSLLRLLSDLLDLSRIESGKLEVVSHPLNVRELVDGCVAMHLPLAEAKGLDLHCQVETFGRVYLGDALRIQQVLTNLIGNAIKFTERGAITVVVQSRPNGPAGDSATDSDRETIHFEVHDTGLGIPKDLQARVFEAFVQVDGSLGREHGGAGLGLAISARLVELMGGTIGLESIPSSGSKFWFDLPLTRAEVPDESPSPKAGDPPVGRADGEERNVLVVEDDEVNRRFVTETLSLLGHQSFAVADGSAALGAIESLPPFDAILLDLHLPQIDGYETARLIRELSDKAKAQTPIIAISAATIDSEALKSSMHRFAAILTKPVGVNEIASALHAVRRSSSGSGGGKGNGGGDSSVLPGATARWGAVLDRLQGRQDLFCELAEIFLAGLHDRLRDLETGITQGDLKGAHRAAHTLAGQSSVFGAADAQVTLARIQSRIAAGDCPACKAEWSSLKEQLGALELELAAAIKSIQQTAGA